MINSGRNIVLMLVGVVMVAALVGASQGGAAPAKLNPVPAPAAAPAPTSSLLSWAEVLEQNPDPKVVTDADFLKRITETRKSEFLSITLQPRRGETILISRVSRF